MYDIFASYLWHDVDFQPVERPYHYPTNLLMARLVLFPVFFIRDDVFFGICKTKSTCHFVDVDILKRRKSMSGSPICVVFRNRFRGPDDHMFDIRR